MESSSNIHIYKKKTPTPKSQRTLQKRGQKNARARRSGSLLTLCLLTRSNATSKKSHQHNCLNMSSVSVTSVGMPKSMRKDHEVFHGLHKGILGVGEHLPQGKAH